MAIDKFSTLEQRITKLLASYQEIKSENAALKEALSQKDREIEAIGERLRKLDGEKDLVKERVEGLLERLDNLIHDA